MPDKIHAAAERIIRAEEPCEGSGCERYCCQFSGKRRQDEIDLAQAALMSKPADDAIRAAALALCQRLQSPAMEYLHASIQTAWSKLYDLVDPARKAE